MLECGAWTSKGSFYHAGGHRNWFLTVESDGKDVRHVIKASKSTSRWQGEDSCNYKGSDRHRQSIKGNLVKFRRIQHTFIQIITIQPVNFDIYKPLILLFQAGCTGVMASFFDGINSCGCWRSSPVDVNFVLVGSLRGAPKKSTVGRLLRGAKDDGGGGWTPSIEPPLPNRHVYVGCVNNVLCYVKEGRRSGWAGKEIWGARDEVETMTRARNEARAIRYLIRI